MKNCRLLLFAFVAVVCSSKSRDAQANDPPRPNILYFYVDDMGWGAIGPNGQAARKAKGLPYVRTPNLDRLAAEGLNFTRGYGCTVCSPARSSQQTGFHQGHTFADRNDPNNAKKAIRTDDLTMGDVLSKAGYVTGYWGKWGYGGSKDRVAPVIQNIQTLPTSHGYKHVLAELHHVRAHTFFQPTLWHAPASSDVKGGLELVANSMAAYQDKTSWPQTPALQRHPEYPKTAYCDDTYAFAALEFVRKQGQKYNNTGQPFFGLLAVQIPHAPFAEIATLPEWDSAYKGDRHFSSLSQQSQQWAAMVTRIDAHFGNILAALEDPNNDGDRSDSIAANTLVVFQSDNGGPGGKSNLEFDANGGLNGTKGKIQEGGIRVPLVMRWPAKITSESKFSAGSSCDRVVDVTDLLPTFCEVAGASIPLGIDGVSIARLLTGGGHQRHREYVIHEAGNGQSIIRGRYKLVRSKRGALSLFDLKTDPSESENVGAKHPNLAKDLELLLLAERVAEPRGFANTYHHWVGGTENALAAENWSNYQYANDGITYLRDNGGPKPSWVATIENDGNESRVLKVNSDVEILALAIRGNAKNRAEQHVVIDSGVTLTGRNEIRLENSSVLAVHGGTVCSRRWIDVKPNASVSGWGTICGSMYNRGAVLVGGNRGHDLKVTGDYFQSADGLLKLTISRANSSLVIHGQAKLGGRLAIKLEDGFQAEPGWSATILLADNIQGRFSAGKGGIVADNRSHFSITYSESSVVLTSE